MVWMAVRTTEAASQRATRAGENMEKPDIHWESIARDLQQRLEQAQFERDEMRAFLKWMRDDAGISKGLKVVIAEALKGHY